MRTHLQMELPMYTEEVMSMMQTVNQHFFGSDLESARSFPRA
jgi:hypothetical protein